MANNPISKSIPVEKIKDFLAEEEIRSCVNNSISDGMNRLCARAQLYDTTVKAVADSYVRNVFPFFKRTPDKQAWDVETEPAPELQNFWSEVSKVSGYEFNQLESYLLSVEGGVPLIFLNRMMSALDSLGRKSLSELYLLPIRSAIKQEKYDYSSIDEMIGK